MDRHYRAIIIGGGISGLVTLKTLQQKGIDCVLYEANEYHGGLWHYTPNNYGVMECTHINVSKYNYAFSDFPFPDDCTEFPHHSTMASYIDKYVEHFGLYNHIEYRTKVLETTRVSTSDGQIWRLACHSRARSTEFVSTCDYLIVATGHHAKPKNPSFPGQSAFKGTIIHGVDYKDVTTNGFRDKNVVIIGIGNSAVDAAVNCANSRGSKSVHLSTRSGAWVLPNYVFAQPIDLYASRFFINYLPFRVKQFILETIVRVITGSPERWNLDPKMGALQTQPTVSPTLIHHIQRGNITIVPNIREIGETSVVFDDGTAAFDVDVIVKCTGYTIDLPFLPEDIVSSVLDSEANDLKLYKNVFSPKIGPELAFIGFVQPTSGGILPMSEIQAQWLAMIIMGRTKLPPVVDMKEAIIKDRIICRKRFYKSSRHTIQQDPITYVDEISEMIGSKPNLVENLPLAPRLLFGSGGVAQWSLQGPFYNKEAAQLVRRVPVPRFSLAIPLVALIAFYYLVCLFFSLLDCMF
ncbi:flavin-containing monooxygenase 5-like [Watersipora subatra]|uniref:flavin-containing monooxygenase 5-like n=1 Tax=Watersipora subatra TaxID=2589382 RepID=UPI00355C39CF